MKAKDHLLMAYAHVQQLWPIVVLINLWGPTGPKIGMHLHSHAELLLQCDHQVLLCLRI